MPHVDERGSGGAAFAAILMMIGGGFGILQGIALIAKDDYYVQPQDYFIDTDGSTWGWTLLIVGLIVVAAAFGVLQVRSGPGGWASPSSASKPSGTSCSYPCSPTGPWF
jgi:hypothetical protein